MAGSMHMGSKVNHKTEKYDFHDHNIREMSLFSTLFLDDIDPSALLTVCADKQQKHDKKKKQWV